MNVTTIGLDLAKSVFQVHGIDAHGKTLITRQLRRGKVLEFFAHLPACLVGIEACPSAHHWAREISKLGHEVRLMPPGYVKPTSSVARTIGPTPRPSARRCGDRPCASYRSRARSSRLYWFSTASARCWSANAFS
jgi:transposase